MGRAPCCDKANVKKGPWSPEEDAKLKEYIEKHGTGGNWIALPQKVGLRRCGKSCRLRWLNYLRPNIKHGEFSDDEDRIICSLFASIGSRWSIIAAQLPGRTDNDIKNYWNTKLKKKLMMANNSMSPVYTQYQKKQPHQLTMYPTPPNHSLLQEPSISSSPNYNSQIIIPSISYDQYDSTNINYYNNYSTPFSNFTSLISSNYNIASDGFSGPARDNYDNNSQDLFSQSYDFSNGVNNVDDEKFLLGTTTNIHHGYSSSSLSSSSSTAPNDGALSFSGINNPLDYSIEEIKELISTNDHMCNNLNFFVDEMIIKTEEENN